MRNEATLEALERELARNCGDDLAAAKAVGVSLQFVNQWRKDDKETDARLVEATRVGRQGLVSAAIQRAVHGVEKGVYYKGMRVDTQVEYSDGLLTTLLKGFIDDFKKEDSTGVNVNVNVANIMPRAESYEQWLAMKDQTLNKPALPAPSDEAIAAYKIMAPPDVIEAEYVEVLRQSAFEGIDL